MKLLVALLFVVWSVSCSAFSQGISNTVTGSSRYSRIFLGGFPEKKTGTKTQPLWLSSSASSTTVTESSDNMDDMVVDTEAIAKWGLALGTQLSLLALVMRALDKITAGLSLPAPAVFAFFYFFLLKTRIFNPLSNQRPRTKNLETTADDSSRRNMPKWTPPGVVFPIMWLLIIGPLRAAAATMIYFQQSPVSSFANPVLMTLLLHLSVGDIWNTINNVERRYGTSVPGVALVWLSKAYAAYSFYQVRPLAGKLLGITLIWLSIATTLIFNVWKLNPDPSTGQPMSWIPKKAKGSKSVTRFAWFSK